MLLVWNWHLWEHIINPNKSKFFSFRKYYSFLRALEFLRSLFISSLLSPKKVFVSFFFPTFFIKFNFKPQPRISRKKSRKEEWEKRKKVFLREKLLRGAFPFFLRKMKAEKKKKKFRETKNPVFFRGSKSFRFPKFFSFQFFSKRFFSKIKKKRRKNFFVMNFLVWMRDNRYSQKRHFWSSLKFIYQVKRQICSWNFLSTRIFTIIWPLRKSSRF